MAVPAEGADAPAPRRARGRPRRDDPGPSTAALLDAALDAFAERGYDATSVRQIARDLGVSHNLIPQRIGTKEALWYASVEHGFGSLSLALVEAVSGTDGGGADDLGRLRALVRRFIEANAARPALLRIINQEATVPGPRLDHLVRTYIDPVAEVGAELLDQLRTRGEVSEVSVTLLYFFMTHGAGGPIALPALASRLGGAVDPDDPDAVRRHAEAATALLFDGLTRR